MALTHYSLRQSAIVSILVLGVGLTACSSNDNDGDNPEGSETPTSTPEGGDTPTPTPTPAENIVTLDLTLDSAITVPPANVDGATGTGSITVNTDDGAISGSVTVSGTTGRPTVGHVHEAPAGEAGPVVFGLDSSEDGNTWSVPEGTVLDTPQLAAFEAGNLYINIHTEANAGGELRVQLAAPVAEEGSYTITFRNTSESQPMTPPVVALHTPVDGENGIRLFEVGATAIPEVVAIAEDGAIGGLYEVVVGQISAGTVSAAARAFPDPANPGPILPGGEATITLTPSDDNQVLSLVSMVVCTNDGFSGIDSRPLANETFTAPIYDAGSETNVLTLDYWVPPCNGGESPNLGDDENGSITAHPGQSGSENPVFDFAAGTELLEVTVSRN